MNTRKTGIAVRRCVVATLTLAAGLARAANLWDLSLEELGRIPVTTIASGTETPLDKAPAIATVITADDIAAMGATDIDQVLETVPGLHVGRTDQAFTPKYLIRGIATALNPQTLVLINGIPITTLFAGNRGNAWAGMPVKAIARIEVIRGPGSAVYGADAFSGVINIVTRNAADMPGLETGIRGGSFNTRGAWVNYGGRRGDTDIGFSLEGESTDGWAATVSRDFQTTLDGLFGSHASLAPGPLNTMKRTLEARLEIERGPSRLRAGYQGRDHIGTGAGIGLALDPNGRAASHRYNVDYTLSASPSQDWNLENRVSYYRYTQHVIRNFLIFPPGAFGGAFPDGFIGNPEYIEANARYDFSAVFTGLDRHRLRLGGGFYWGDMSKVQESKNFTIALMSGNAVFLPRPNGLEDVSDTPDAFLPEKQRTSRYLFAQDEWKPAARWQVTTGLRYDRYSDFGDTVNPRAALVWTASDSVTAKLLYGRAFRAPSFTELYASGNPVTVGNPGLKPETIDSYELGLSQRISPDLLCALNVFEYRINDLITLQPGAGGVSRAENTGGRRGRGAEVEADFAFSPALRIVGNASWQHADDVATGDNVGEAPGYEAYLRAEWLFRPDWQGVGQLTRTGPQGRASGDARPPVAASTTLDLTLRRRNITDGLDLALMIRNLTDADVREPSPSKLPDDFPMAGRSLLAELSYRFP